MSAELRAMRAPWRDEIQFLLSDRSSNGRLAAVEALQWKLLDEGELAATPTFTIATDQAQRLMDELWNCGLRPSEGSGSAGALAATQRHLDDMRSLSFNLLGVKK